MLELVQGAVNRCSKLGASTGSCTDLDEVAVRSAKENIVLNKVENISGSDTW